MNTKKEWWQLWFDMRVKIGGLDTTINYEWCNILLLLTWFNFNPSKDK